MALKHRTKIGFTLIEVIIITVGAFIVLLPIAAMMGAVMRDWTTSRKIKSVQEDLDFAAYAIKYRMEEYSSIEGVYSMPTSDITLKDRDGSLLRIYLDDGKLKMDQNNSTSEFTANVSELTFYPVPAPGENNFLILVNIKIEKENISREMAFNVYLRN